MVKRKRSESHLDDAINVSSEAQKRARIHIDEEFGICQPIASTKPIARAAASSTSPLHQILSKLTHLDLTGQVVYDNSVIKAHGGYCDVFLGEYTSFPGKKVAVKRLRIHTQSERDFGKVCWL